MSTSESLTGAHVRALQIIHIMLTVGQVAMLGAAVALRPPVFALQTDDKGYFLVLVILLLIVVSQTVRRTLLNRARAEETLEHKLGRHRMAYVIFMALRETITVGLVVGYIGNLLQAPLLLLAGYNLILFVFLRPTVARTAQELELRPEEV